MTVLVADVDRWDAGDLREIFDACRNWAEASAEAADGIATLPGLAEWGGDTAQAARDAQHSLSRDLDAHGQQASAVADAASRAADAIEDVKRQLDDLRQRAEDVGLRINPITNRVFVGVAVDTADERRAALDARPGIESGLAALLAHAAQVDDALAAAIISATGGAASPDTPRPDAAPPHDGVALVDHETTLGPEPEGNRRPNQVDAFEELFGRPPRTPNDLSTAAALDPHSYSTKNAGHPPHIVVGRIEPVPGQGVVRANLFIPSRGARSFNIPPLQTADGGKDWYALNAGDDRGFSVSAGPEESRVVLHVDYDNGVVIARQNPSVNLDTGEVATGTPDVKVTQTSDGSVLIAYAAADPLSPGGESVAKATPWTANGTLAISPSDAGPQIGGRVTSFPALEVYSDRPGADTAPLVQHWPTDVSQWGPARGLPFDVEVGDQRIVSDFNSYFPAPLEGAELPSIDRAPSAVPLGPEVTVLPPRAFTELGSPADAPRVVVRDPVHILPGR